MSEIAAAESVYESGRFESHFFTISKKYSMKNSFDFSISFTEILFVCVFYQEQVDFLFFPSKLVSKREVEQ